MECAGGTQSRWMFIERSCVWDVSGAAMIPFDAEGSFNHGASGHQLRRLAVRGAVVTVSASGVALAAQVVSTFVLARLLIPADFGVVTMATTFSLLLVNCGFNGFTEAIIQF